MQSRIPKDDKKDEMKKDQYITKTLTDLKVEMEQKTQKPGACMQE